MLKTVALGVLLAAASVCNVPVFRYALERWRAAPYPAVVLHRGPLDPAARRLLAELEQAGLNVSVSTADVSGPLDPDVRRLWEAEAAEPLPRLVLTFPDQPEAVAWRGPFDAPGFRALADSPVRRETVRRLVTGTSVVWLLFESGDASRDQAAAALVQGELARLETVLKIPKPAPDDPPLRSAVPLKVAFSLLRVPKDQPDEAAFLATLSRARRTWSLPALVPVFGRGRALASLCGAEISAPAVARMAEYVTDACSCEVKELNPGVDLLFTADWDGLLEAGPAPADPPAPPPVLQLPKGHAAPPPAPVSATSSGAPRHLLWAGLGTAVFVTVIAGWLAFRKTA